MRVKGSYEPGPLEFEVINKGSTALIRFYENVEPYEEPETDTQSATSGYEFDRYTIERRYEEGLKERIEADVPLWREFAKQQERDALSAEVRAKRTALLAETDWTQALDAPIGAASREALRLYRQQLRDITERPEFPYITQWPERPVIEKDTPNPVDKTVELMQGDVDMAMGCIMELADEVYAEPVREDVAMLKGCVMELVEMIAPLFE